MVDGGTKLLINRRDAMVDGGTKLLIKRRDAMVDGGTKLLINRRDARVSDYYNKNKLFLISKLCMYNFIYYEY